MRELSILTPPNLQINYRKISDVTMHDLALDVICSKIAENQTEKEIIRRFMSSMTDDARVTKYRIDVFDDLMRFPKMREKMLELLEKIDFLKSYGTFRPGHEEAAGAWELLHRLSEISDYINCVEAMYECLLGIDIQSEGLINIRNYVSDLFEDKGFAELKEDIGNLKADISCLKSVTLGVNLNERFEAESVGIISLNSKTFKEAGLLSNLSGKLSAKDNVNESEEWNGDMKFRQASHADLLSLADASARSIAKTSMLMTHPIYAATMANVPEGDKSNVMEYMDKIASQMISLSVKRLREVLQKYVYVSIRDISNLIPEFIYYIRWAEYIEKLQRAGVKFCKPKVRIPQESNDISGAADGLNNNDRLSECCMKARGIYNLKLLELASNDMAAITTNDLDFDEDKRVYILTGANRGGKTTITQAIGQLFVLAQGGIFIPGDSFEFSPVDGIFTHFPADEDKTLDLGRLGEECQRFKELFDGCSRTSLLLLNETFSTTSFEEGYYIAFDAVKAILRKGVRTIYNTHMHKLAYEIDSINEAGGDGKAASLIVKSEEGNRTYKVEVAPPIGNSFAKDIAKKYGVTYEQLID